MPAPERHEGPAVAVKPKLIQAGLIYGSAEEPLSREKQVVLNRVGPARRVLEVGSHAGAFSAALKRQGCAVTAVELDPRAAAQASLIADRVICGDIEDPATWTQIEAHYDVVLFMHVLEHLVDPWRIVGQSRALLARGGRLLVLLPNVASWQVRKRLFFRGEFEYADLGIMDRTHLRFFTLESGRRLLESQGFRILAVEPIDICVPLERRLSRIPGLASFSRRWHHWMWNRHPNLCTEIWFFEAAPALAGSGC